MNPTTRSTAPGSRRRRIMTAGVVAAGLSIAGAGAAIAGDDSTTEADAIPEADQSTMPEGFTAEQYEAFWQMGYSYDDVLELNALWDTEDTETKARAGQMILDGLTVPVAPSGPDEAEAPLDPADPAAIATGNQLEAFWAAGYTGEDAEALSALWETDFLETKTLAGQMILDGEALPVAPTGTPAAS
ncbi:hypothetical protein [Sanguibacter sp. 25GB23B1]|uniref:hypothetical protein n=1 Tax=unclassified Sanguibacter TaxID=2645534 RepID=UPI0032AE9A66